MSCSCVNVLGYGLLSYMVARSLSIIYNIIYPYFIYPGIQDLARFSKGKWAVVTGSTDGIGKGYAFELARKGMNLVLIARNPEKLSATKKEINEKYSGIEIKTVTFDFTANSAAKYKEMYNSNMLDKLDVGILVNNVGMSHEYPEFVTAIPSEKMVDLVQCNMLSVVVMTQLFLNKMKANKAGVIINLSSASDMIPMPLISVYSASKSFVNYVTYALQAELKDDGITCQTVVPFYVATNMSQIRRTSFLVPNPITYAKSALRTLGAQQRTNGYWTHQLQAECLSLLPNWLVFKIVSSQLHAVRQAKLRKLAKEQ